MIIWAFHLNDTNGKCYLILRFEYPINAQMASSVVIKKALTHG